MTKQRQGQHDVRILDFNGRSFVTGLRWHTLRSSAHFMREARAFGRENDMDIVVIREGLVTQGGFVSKNAGVAKNMYSAASVLIDAIGPSFLAVFKLSENEFYLLATDKNSVIPDTDLIGSREYIYGRMVELNSMFEWSDENIIAPDDWSFAGEEADLNDFLIPSNANRKHRLKQLTFGLSKVELVKYGLTSVVVLSGVFGYFTYKKHNEKMLRQAQMIRQQALEREQMEALEKLRAEQRRLIESSSLTRPWTLTPPAMSTVNLCEQALLSMPISIGGWAFEKAYCSPVELRAEYRRLEGATNLSYLKEYKSVFPNNNVHSSISNDDRASFSIKMNMLPAGDDIKHLRSDMRDVFVSHFQRIGMSAVVNSAPSRSHRPAILPDGSPWPEEMDPPAPTWDTFTFAFDSSAPPSSILAPLPTKGMRVAAIEMNFNASSTSFSWRTVGEFYASR